MGDVVNFPGNDRQTAAFDAYLRRCGKPGPDSGQPCIDPAGHDGAHRAELGQGWFEGWWDNPPRNDPEPTP